MVKCRTCGGKGVIYEPDPDLKSQFSDALVVEFQEGFWVRVHVEEKPCPDCGPGLVKQAREYLNCHDTHDQVTSPAFSLIRLLLAEIEAMKERRRKSDES
uniref:Uncharacterized protein n=1 Tax=viral metagenome TaxID=1070528 RepID=A0A6H1ZLB8_9ZZZZ